MSNSTQNDWEIRFDEFRNYDGSEYGSDFHYRIKDFIRKELADARREVITETIKKIEAIKTTTPFEVKESDVPYHIGVRNKTIDDVLATLRKEEV